MNITKASLLMAAFVFSGSVATAQVVTTGEESLETATPAPFGETPKTDWYRRFSGASQGNMDVWQTEPTDDQRLAWIESRRWQLNVDLLSRPETSPLPREEMQAGASFKITPRFSIGADISVGANELDDSSQWEDQQVETGVRLKSAFKF